MWTTEFSCIFQVGENITPGIFSRNWICMKHQFYSRKLTTLKFWDAPSLLEELVSRRSGLSEDSDLAVISAFRARALLSIRYTFPIPLIFDQLADLIAIFELKSVTVGQLRCTQRTLWKFFKQRIPLNRHTIQKYGHRMRTIFESSIRQGRQD